MLIKALKIPLRSIGRLEDVKFDKWYYPYVMTANYYGLNNVADSEFFYPEEPITREDMVYYAGKLLENKSTFHSKSDVNILNNYTDKNIIAPHVLSYFSVFVENNIISGRNKSFLYPKDKATRAEACVFIHNLINIF